jgi:hypothetical protein
VTQRVEDLPVLRVPFLGVLREDHLAVGDDVEDATVTFDQLGLDAELVLQRVRQTGGSGKVVSTYAVGDRYVHEASWKHEAPL